MSVLVLRHQDREATIQPKHSALATWLSDKKVIKIGSHALARIGLTFCGRYERVKDDLFSRCQKQEIIERVDAFHLRSIEKVSEL